jgi:CheY-like chemotaxis protein
VNVRAINILLVDDSPSDRSLVELAFADSKILNHLMEAEDGEDALAVLRDPEQPRPDLILLDLNMPGMDGRQFLRAVKADEDLMTIPVVILTSSVAEDDVAESYRNHCAGYVRKPVELDGLVRVIQAISEYWFAIVVRP